MKGLIQLQVIHDERVTMSSRPTAGYVGQLGSQADFNRLLSEKVFRGMRDEDR